ncbi:AraC family transcriptional regulator ligand-binding domain-containing protein [Paraburkholderia sacchari]|uniref:AraC family transcriptional regulator n=1 Tax=Paraburkholderia sacchari TaxID=159450 RepID=UPI0039A506CB
MTPYLRGWVLQGLAPLIEDLGGHAGQYATRFHLPLNNADHNALVIPAASLVRLMEACADDLSCPDFGIRTGAALGGAPLGPVMLALMQCATVGEAIETAARLMNILNPALELTFQILPTGEKRLAYQLKLARIGRARQFEEWCIAINIKIFQILAGPDARPRAVFLTNRPLLPKKAYASAFGCPVRFSQAEFGVDYSASDCSRTLAGHSPQLKSVVTDYLERIAETSGLDLENQLEWLISQLLPTGRCSLEMIASHYYVSARTMQRRLEDKGLVFETVMDGIRRERAVSYLEDSTLRLSQIATLLGYGAQSSFSHAFQRWYGMSPTSWRRRSRAGLDR